MRLDLFALVFVIIASASLALADPPAAAPSQPAATSAPTSSPAAATPQAAPAAAAAKPPVDPREQRLLSQGFKPMTRNGEKLFCKRETQLGSRLSTVERCGTVDQLSDEIRVSRDQTDSVQRTQVNPSGH